MPMQSAMERNSFWLWTRMKLGGSIPTSVSESWEERAFAEDTSGRLGSCVWPPRSYSCSFCRREFGSAQALGGHMNVHRRDRARLHQSSPPTTLEINVHNDHQPQHYANPNNPVSSPTRFVLPSTQQVAYSYEQHHLTLPCSTPVCKQIQTTSDLFPTHKLLSDPFLPETGARDSLGIWIKKDNADARCIGCKEKRSHKEEDEDGECFTSSCKQQRINNETLSPLSRRSSPSDDPPQLEEVDLELRLGNQPKVKYILNESSAT